MAKTRRNKHKILVSGKMYDKYMLKISRKNGYRERYRHRAIKKSIVDIYARKHLKNGMEYCYELLVGGCMINRVSLEKLMLGFS